MREFINIITEATQEYERKLVDPALLTFDEYHKLVNPANKFHDSSAYNIDTLKDDFYNKKENFPDLVRRFKINNITFELRVKKTDRFIDRQFVKSDENGNMLRDKNGQAIFYTVDELIKLNKKRYEYDFAICDGEDIVGYTTDEWGCVLVVVTPQYKGFGLGPILVKELRSIEPTKQSGGFTSGGHYNFRKVYREFVRDYLKSGMYSYLIRQNVITLEKVKEIIASANVKEKPKHKDLNLNSNNPADWLLYMGEGDFVIYDKKLKDLLHDEKYDHFAEKMIKGVILCRANDHFATIPVFGAENDKLKKFLMSLGLSITKKYDETCIIEKIDQKYLPPTVEIKEYSQSMILVNYTGEIIDVSGLGRQEQAFRKEFDKYGEFKDRMLEMAYSKFSN